MALEDQLRSRRETRALELKAPMSWADRATQGKIIKAALAFANLRDGGAIAFGLNEASPFYDLTGLSQPQYESFAQDAVSAVVNSHVTPYVDLTVEHFPIDDRLFVVIAVRPFSDYPAICSCDFVVEQGQRPLVIKGRMYCRSRRTPESTEVQAPDDLREIVELAVDKGVERYFRHREIERKTEGPSVREMFRRQREGL